MNCLEFRRRVGAEPSLSTPEIEAHEQSCPACAKYRQELLKMDKLIHRALSIVPEAPAKISTPKTLHRPMRWATAAVLLIGILIGGTLWISLPRESLAVELVKHAKGEPDSFAQTTNRADAAELADILAKAKIHLRDDALLVSYSHRCLFRGHFVPHLAVQTANGPVIVIVLAEEKPVERAQSFDAEGFHGVILPAPRGALAALGNGPEVETAAKKILSALEYQP